MKQIAAILLGALCLLLAAPAPVFGLYFNVVEGVPKCFIQEVPEDTLVLLRYVSLDHSKLTTVGMESTLQLYVKDPMGNAIATHDAAGEGRFAWTSQMGGEHQVCIKSTTSNFQGSARTFRFQLASDSGDAAQDYGEIAKQEHLSAIEVEVRKLNDKVRGVRNEQDYQKKCEEKFRDMSESTNSRVMWWSILQTVVLVMSGLWQIRNMTKLFKDKKVA